MYLSLINVEKSIKNARILNNSYKVHQIIWEAFGKGERDFLFRTEIHLKAASNWQIYLMSKNKPDFAKMINKSKLSITKTQTKQYSPNIQSGTKLRFYLRANPTVKKKKKRRILLHEEELLEWIKRKGEQNGFKPISISFSNKQKYTCFKIIDGKKIKITHGGIDFHGILQVNKVDQFMSSQTKGIGSAKAFGFGLLNIMPL